MFVSIVYKLQNLSKSTTLSSQVNILVLIFRVRASSYCKAESLFVC